VLPDRAARHEPEWTSSDQIYKSVIIRAMSDFASAVAAGVRAERARRQWHQQELGRRLGWSVGMVSALETGQRGIQAGDLPLLCRAFGLTLKQLAPDADRDDMQVLGLA
jgi:ribosome-binding protein aMBF1 (putative translation factor)